MADIRDAAWRNEWVPFLTRVGLSKAVLFVPRVGYPERYQNEVTFGRMSGVAKGQHKGWDVWVLEATITSLAP